MLKKSADYVLAVLRGSRGLAPALSGACPDIDGDSRQSEGRQSPQPTFGAACLCGSARRQAALFGTRRVLDFGELPSTGSACDRSTQRLSTGELSRVGPELAEGSRAARQGRAGEKEAILYILWNIVLSSVTVFASEMRRSKLCCNSLPRG